MLAVAYGHSDAVSLLLEKEANVDAVDIMGCTALHRGVCTSSLALVKQFCSELVSSFFFFTSLWIFSKKIVAWDNQLTAVSQKEITESFAKIK